MIYFVTETYMKTYTTLNDNVDSNVYITLVKTAADGFVRSYLGDYFYKYLLTAYNAQTLNADEIILVQDYIQDAIAWRVLSDATFSTSYQVTNKGVQKQSGDFSDNPGFQGVSFMSHFYKSKADFYDNRLRTYLIDNKDLYPEFISDLNQQCSLKPFCKGKSSFDSGIMFI